MTGKLQIVKISLSIVIFLYVLVLGAGTKLHRNTFAQGHFCTGEIFARWDTFARRHFNTSLTVRVGLGLGLRLRFRVKS